MPPSLARPVPPRTPTRPVTPRCTKPAKAPQAKDFTNQSSRHAGIVDEAVRSKSRNKSKILAWVEHRFGVANIYLGRQRLLAQVRPLGLQSGKHMTSLFRNCAFMPLYWPFDVCVRATHLEDGLTADDSVHDEDHAHHGERSSPQSSQTAVLQSRTQDPNRWPVRPTRRLYCRRRSQSWRQRQHCAPVVARTQPGYFDSSTTCIRTSHVDGAANTTIATVSAVGPTGHPYRSPPGKHHYRRQLALARRYGLRAVAP
jgi:hypothetical protein